MTLPCPGCGAPVPDSPEAWMLRCPACGREEPSPRRLRAWLTWFTVATLSLVVVLYAVARLWR